MLPARVVRIATLAGSQLRQRRRPGPDRTMNSIHVQIPVCGRIVYNMYNMYNRLLEVLLWRWIPGLWAGRPMVSFVAGFGMWCRACSILVLLSYIVITSGARLVFSDKLLVTVGRQTAS